MSMLQFLKAYIKIDTAHPSPNYQQALNLFRQQAEHDGFMFKQIVMPSGDPVGIITYPGTDQTLPALALNHHMDVVPAPNKTDWDHPPFAGIIQNGLMVGRGTQDMKGIGVIHYFALKSLKEKGVKPKRTIHILMVPDEEHGGFKGTKEFVESETFKELNIGFVLDEGLASGDPSTLLLKVSERKPLQIRLTCKGELAHASQLHHYNPVHEMTQFLNKVVVEQEQQKTNTTAPGLLLSMHITSFSAGVFNKGKVALNVIPSEAIATIDIRVPPTITLKKAQQKLDTMLKEFPNIHYTIEAISFDMPQKETIKTKLYLALEKTLSSYNINAKPLFFEAASDLRFYLKLGIDGIGFTPFTCASNLHGTNESVPCSDLEQGKKIIQEFLHNFCIT